MGLNKKLREQVYNKFDGKCGYCGERIKYKEMQVDHIIPQVDFIKRSVKPIHRFYVDGM